jgi:hypothetical protein
MMHKFPRTRIAITYFKKAGGTVSLITVEKINKVVFFLIQGISILFSNECL